jgi:hypothetical protein
LAIHPNPDGDPQVAEFPGPAGTLLAVIGRDGFVTVS